jgi:hypothetical protein
MKQKDRIPSREMSSNLPDGFLDGGQEEKDVENDFEFNDFHDIDDE